MCILEKKSANCSQIKQVCDKMCVKFETFIFVEVYMKRYPNNSIKNDSTALSPFGD